MNNEGADQPAHLRSLISSFVNHLLESIISRLAMRVISFFQLVSVSEQAGLNITLSETLMTGLLASQQGAQWLSGRVLESRPKGCRFEPHQCHCVVSLSKTH